MTTTEKEAFTFVSLEIIACRNLRLMANRWGLGGRLAVNPVKCTSRGRHAVTAKAIFLLSIRTIIGFNDLSLKIK